MTMQLMPLVIFWAIMAAFIVCGCILTRKPTKMETLLRAALDKRQPGCFALEDERGADWKGGGGAVPSIKETRPSL